jgi:hypothetical protein
MLSIALVHANDTQNFFLDQSSSTFPSLCHGFIPQFSAQSSSDSDIVSQLMSWPFSSANSCPQELQASLAPKATFVGIKGVYRQTRMPL